MTNFSIGMPEQTRRPLEALQLPIDQRRQLCLDLLHEFGAENISISGNEIRHRCNLPFQNHSHGDTTNKAHLNFEKLTFHCWVCGGGGFLWWLATMRDSSDIETREWLARRSGIGGVQGVDELLAFLDSITSASVEHQEVVLPHYDERILDQWSFIHPYLTDFRAIPAQNVIDSKVGYGVLRVRVGENEFKSSQRITIPHFWKGQLVGWQSRRITDDGTEKYLSTPSFPKDFTLYNFDPAATATVVVEAPISVVAQRHNAHLEATFGASVTKHQLSLLAQHTGEIILWMDNDPAGWNAVENLCEFLTQRTSLVSIIDSPYAADPADLDSATFVKGLVEWRTPWFLWHRPMEPLLEWRRDANPQVRLGAGAS